MRLITSRQHLTISEIGEMSRRTRREPDIHPASGPARRPGDGRPEDSSNGCESAAAGRGTRRRVASVYDAVAGRVRAQSGIDSTQIAAPEEVLLRRVNAPTHLPHDFYRADERLGPDQRLPDSDLLNAIHAYVSDYYFCTSGDHGRRDFRSLDETALLAMGILLEEAAAEELGENGDNVLLEPEGLEQGLPETTLVRHQVKGRVPPPTMLNRTRGLTHVDPEFAWDRPSKKRRGMDG